MPGHLDSAEERAWRLDFLSLREEDQGPELMGKVEAGLQVVKVTVEGNTCAMWRSGGI